MSTENHGLVRSASSSLDNEAVELRALSDEGIRVVAQAMNAAAADLRAALPGVPVFLGAP